MRWVSIDPGLRHVGLAVWSDRDLLSAELVRSNAGLRGPAQWTDTALRVQAALRCPWIGRLVTEYPQWDGRSTVSRTDLIELAGACGAIVAAVAGPDVEVVGVTPAEWKGRGSKEDTVRQIKQQLPEAQLDILARCLDSVPRGRRFDVTDAVGIGLWYINSRGIE